MFEIEDSSDNRNKSWCIYCGSGLNQSVTNKDHVPTKGLLSKERPDNLPVVEVCQHCNSSFSKDEEYLIAFLSSVLSGSTKPEEQTIPTAKDILNWSNKLRARIDNAKVVKGDLFGEEEISWEPEWERINRVVIKNARGHAYFEMGEPMLHDPSFVTIKPLQRLVTHEIEEFEKGYSVDILPEVGSRMMSRMISGQDLVNGWVVVEDDVYRYAVEPIGGIRVKTVIWEYLASEVWWLDN